MRTPLQHSGIRLAHARGLPRGLTLLEMLIVIVILGILLTLAFPMVDSIRRKAERAGCLSQLRSLHGSFTSYVTENRHWPQVPDFDDEEKYWASWIQVLAPYGAGPDVWLCPTEKRLIAQGAAEAAAAGEGEGPRIMGSYVPTPFGPEEFTPFRWSQPWLVEKGDFHGGGVHLIMPDGSIRTSDQLLSSN